MLQRSYIIALFTLILLFLVAAIPQTMLAQVEEPDVRGLADPVTPYSEGFRNSWSVDIMLNNFGYGVGGQYSRVLGPYTELTFKAGVTGIRDVSELTFQDIFTGRQLIPNKYNRAFGFPFSVGLKKRLFARHIHDNFRLFIEGAGGPAMAFVFPYLNDADQNGFRTYQVTDQGFLIPVESVNDFFSGWKDGESRWGLNGEIKIGADIGSKFKTQTTIEIGYFFYYFDPGLQIMEPFQPWGYNPETGQPVAVNEDGERNPFFNAQKYFGTPQIKIIFGGMW